MRTVFSTPKPYHTEPDRIYQTPRKVGEGVSRAVYANGIAIPFRGTAIIVSSAVMLGGKAIIADDGAGNQLQMSVQSNGDTYLVQIKGHTGFDVALTYQSL